MKYPATVKLIDALNNIQASTETEATIVLKQM